MKSIFFYKNLLLIPVIYFIAYKCYGNSSSYYQDRLDLSKKEYMAGNYAKSLEYLIETKTLAENNNLPDIQISALNHIGLVYTGLLNYEKAMEYYLEAYQIALRHTDRKNEMKILNNISQLYFLNDEIDKTSHYLNMAYKLAQDLKDSLGLATLMISLGITSNKTGDLELADSYINDAIKIIKNQLKDSALLVIAIYVKTENLYLKGEYNRAKQLALETLEQYSKIINPESKIENLLILSRIYEKEKNLQKAIYYAKEALENDPKLPVTIEIYEQLSDLYRKVNMLPYALQYQDSVIIMKDSLTKLNDMSRLINSQIQFDLINSEKKLAENKEKQRQERELFALIIISIVVFIVIFIWTFHVRSTKNKQLKIITELELEKEKNEKLLLEQQLKEQETLALLEQERLNNEVKEKLLLKQQLREQETLALLEQERLNNEIKEKMLLKQQLKEQEALGLLERERYKNEIKMKNKQLVSKTLFQSSKNELIKDIIRTLSDVPNKSDIPELRSAVRKLRSQIKEPASWDSFLTYFEQINPSFLSSLKEKHPDLTASETRLSSYIYLNLDTKEISKLLNITPEYCRKKKQRLAKKIGLPASKIHNYLVNII